jgi:hypothetical protein
VRDLLRATADGAACIAITGAAATVASLLFAGVVFAIVVAALSVAAFLARRNG